MSTKTRRVIEKILKVFTHNLLKLLTFFVKKKANIWVFGEWYGDSFMGNSKYLYLYIKENCPNVFPVWFTKNKNIYSQITQRGGTVYLYNSFKALYYGLIAKVYVYNTGIEDVYHYALRNAKLINVWHGMPLKRLETIPGSISRGGLQGNGQAKTKKMSLKQIEEKIVWSLTTSRVERSRIDLLVATSETTKKTLNKGFQCPNIRITGQPREDIFYQKISKQEVLGKIGLGEFENNKIVTYLPTFREGKNSYISLLGENEDEAVGFFNKNRNVLVLEKSHYHERNFGSKINSNLLNYRNLSDIEFSSQELLAISDILITDYSSVFVDFLHTDRPIIFFPYDLQSYQKGRDFYYDYEKIACGKIVYNTQDLFNAISAYIENPDSDKEKRKKAKELFHKYTDGKNCQRVYQEIIS